MVAAGKRPSLEDMSVHATAAVEPRSRTDGAAAVELRSCARAASAGVRPWAGQSARRDGPAGGAVAARGGPISGSIIAEGGFEGACGRGLSYSQNPPLKEGVLRVRQRPVVVSFGGIESELWGWNWVGRAS